MAINAATALAAIIGLTQAIFSSDISVSESCDPEWPDDKSIVFQVAAKMSADEAIDRRCEWHKKVSEIVPPTADIFQLRIDRSE